MSLSLLGVNHKSAPVELREKLAIPEQRLAEATRLLADYPGVREGMILSTCNRVEILTSHDASLDQAGPDILIFLGKFFDLEPASLRPHIYEYREQDAMRHLFRVASSLDSMVVGEPQILGQVKQSYSVAREVGAVNGELDRILRRAFTVAKRVRTETKIGASSVNIATVAVEVARKIFGSLHGKTICLVGTGKMGQLAARHLMKQGASRLVLTNRTQAGADVLAAELQAASLSVEVLPFEHLMDKLDADIVITTTGASEPVFRREHGQMLLHRRRNRPVFFIDIAVPRDVDPAMQKLDGIFVYDIDDLQNVASQHREGRNEEAQRAENIIEREVERYSTARQALDAVPAIVAVQQSIESLRRQELARSGVRLANLDEEERQAVDDLTRGLVNKLLHGPLTALKAAARDGDVETLEAIRAALAGDSRSSSKDDGQ
jgi:glutamyl-tRNA reductase